MAINNGNEAVKIWIPNQRGIKKQYGGIQVKGRVFNNLENTPRPSFEGKVILINQLGEKLQLMGSVGEVHTWNKGWSSLLKPEEFFDTYPTPYLITNWDQIQFCYHGLIEIKLTDDGIKFADETWDFNALNLDKSENIFSIIEGSTCMEGGILRSLMTVFSCPKLLPTQLIGLPIYFEDFEEGILGNISKILLVI